MKNLLFVILLLIVFASCNRNSKSSAADMRFCGRWIPGKVRPVYYDFKPDGSFTDGMFNRMSKYSGISLPKPVSWQVKGNLLYLNYSVNRTLFHLFKIPTQFSFKDTVKLINDTTLVLTTPGIRRYASRTISLMKMKEDGRYTTN